MFKDKIIIGIIIGLLADAVKLTVNYILFLFKFTNVVFWQITATRFLEKNDLFKPVAYIIGGIADITVTIILGIIFLYLISFIGREYLWIKGIGFGLLVWVGLFGTLLGQTVQDKLPQEPSSILVTIAAHFFFGLGLAFFTWLFYKFRTEENKEDKKVIYRSILAPAKKNISSNFNNDNEEGDKEILLKRPIKLKSKKYIKTR